MRARKNTRYIENHYNINQIDINSIKSKILNQIKIKEKLLFSKYPPNAQYKIDSLGKQKIDPSFYTGTGGNIYLYWRQYLFYNKSPESLKNFETALHTNLNVLYSKKPNDYSNSFFMGDSGFYLFECIYSIETNNQNYFMEYFKKLISLYKLGNSTQLELEILYGIAGYLYSLLFLKKYLNYQNKINFPFNIIKTLDDTIKKLFSDIINSGIDNMKRYKWNKCLLYPFPLGDKHAYFYLGAAHGLIGNIYLLLSTIKTYPELLNDNIKKILIQNINYIKSLQITKTGNFPDDVQGEDDGEKVHFCHGCVGAIHLFLLANEIFPGFDYAKIAKNCNKCLWERGLLYKGNGLCHGMAGICYALLKLYLSCGDEIYLKEAVGIAMGTFDENVQKEVREYVDPQRKAKGVPDTPYSLMEGDGGLLFMYYDLISVINGEKDRMVMVFPGYEIW